MRFIDANYQTDLSLNAIAEDVYMSVPYLSRLFKEYTNKNFLEYLTEIRMERARELLLYSNKKVNDIALSIGYNNVQSFIRAFKKHFLVPPREYRNMNKKTNLGGS